MRQGLITITVPLSGTVSDDGDLSGGRLALIAVPVITSGDLLIRGSFNTTSANFVRMQNPMFSAPTSGDLRLATGPGSCMMMWPEQFPSPAFIRLETAVPQAVARVFTIRFNG